MLCLLFTREKLFFGLASNHSELLSVHGRSYIDFGSSGPQETLEKNLDDIKLAYCRVLQEAGSAIPEKIQLIVAYPKNFPQKSKEVDEDPFLQKIIEEVAGDEFDVIAAYENSQALISGLSKEAPQEIDSPRLILDSLDERVSVYYEGLNGKAAENGKSKVFFLDEVGMEPGRENILQKLVSSFQDAGLSIDETDIEDLRQQVKNPMRNGNFTLVKSNDLISITAKANLSQDGLEALMTQDHSKLGSFLQENDLNELGIKEVVVMGRYLKLPLIQEYLKENLQLEERLLGNQLLDENEELLTIFNGLSKLGDKELTKRLEEERRKKEELEQKRLKELQMQADRDALMIEIRESCVDPDLIEEYEATYTLKGEKIGLPKEVVIWNIQEAIRIAKLGANIPNKPEVFTSVSLVQPHIGKVEVPPQVSPDSGKDTTPSNSVPILSSLFEVRGVLPDNEFQTKKVYDKKTKELRVLRLCSKQKKNDTESKKKFQHLYEKELAYYGELGDIKEVEEGSYYLRPYFERNTLKEYVRRTEISNKKSIEQLGSSELKLILMVMKEINDLQISHVDINENNILVITKRRWGMNKDMSIKLVGITSEDIPREDMIAQSHRMWERLLGEGFYKHFREKFNL